MIGGASIQDLAWWIGYSCEGDPIAIENALKEFLKHPQECREILQKEYPNYRPVENPFITKLNEKTLNTENKIVKLPDPSVLDELRDIYDGPGKLHYRKREDDAQ